MKIAFDYHGKVFQTEIPKPSPLTALVNSRVNDQLYDVKKSEIFKKL